MRKIVDNQITISLAELEAYNLTPNQYIWLALLYQSGSTIEGDLISSLSDDDLTGIQQDGWASGYGKLTQKTIDFFKDPDEDFDKAFKEFYTTYPRLVPNGKGGKRALRSDGVNSHDATRCRAKYKYILENYSTHDKVMQGLKNEMSERKGDYTFMQMCEVYLNQRSWEKYLDIDAEQKEERTEGI